MKTISDIVCPKCKSLNWYEYSSDEFGFDENGKGHYRFLIHCDDCGEDSRVNMNFEYKVID